MGLVAGMAVLILAIQHIPKVVDKKGERELLREKIAWSGDQVIEAVQEFVNQKHRPPESAKELAQVLDGWLPVNPLTNQPVQILDVNEDGVLRPGSPSVSRAGNIGYFVDGQRCDVMALDEQGLVFRRHTLVPSTDSTTLAQAATR